MAFEIRFATFSLSAARISFAYSLHTQPRGYSREGSQRRRRRRRKIKEGGKRGFMPQSTSLRFAAANRLLRGNLISSLLLSLSLFACVSPLARFLYRSRGEQEGGAVMLNRQVNWTCRRGVFAIVFRNFWCFTRGYGFFSWASMFQYYLIISVWESTVYWEYLYGETYSFFTESLYWRLMWILQD